MTFDPSAIGFFTNASLVVKIVMIILLIASLFSWTCIIQRWLFLGKMRRNVTRMEKEFSKAKDLYLLADKYKKQKTPQGLIAIFMAGYKALCQLSDKKSLTAQLKIDNVRSAMTIEQSRLQELLDQNLSFLATVASTSPYIGLFGTVWGIMTAFMALGTVQQASIAMVAPGISEALIATALGLFAAIPAAIAYNRFTSRVDSLLNRMDIFQEEFIRQLTLNVYSTDA